MIGSNYNFAKIREALALQCAVSLTENRVGSKEAYLFNYNGEPHGLRRRPDQKDDTVRMQEFFDYLLKERTEARHGWRKGFRKSRGSRRNTSIMRCMGRM
jgi:hypothetical protein